MIPPDSPECIAIVGMAGRFPRAGNLEEFWRNLRAGVEAVSFFGENEVEWLPIEHPPRAGDPNFVRARAVLERPEWFDAAFFQLHPREAAIMDPQHRVFLECAWEALENAGCNPETHEGLIGVFAGASFNTYLFTNLLTNKGLVEDHGLFASMIMNSGDFVPTRVSYKFNLRGPSLNVQTACSTSLVAVCLAAQNLLAYRCDVALAGGVSITFPAHRGQHHQEGGILSPDGHCRTFDAKAAGTVLGDGAGVVVLKRLSDALADGDRICAVIKGTAINNDGAVKIGYTAPSSAGQAEVIALAQAEAQVEPRSISYVEAHGTGTPLGDPIEIEGLTQAFGVAPGQKPFCAVGSVKSNIGHLDVAAGVAGLIKTVLALQHREIPPSLHFEQPNPKIDFARSPFFVNHTLRAWPEGPTPRRAGVSSFGIGGTNAHVVLEEAPARPPTSPGRRCQLLVLSARTLTALETATDNLAAHLEAHPEVNLADVAFTLQVGRKVFAHRRAVVCESVADAVQVLRSRDPHRVLTATSDGATPAVAFLFPGQGAQTINMARELYETESTFRADVDRSCDLLVPLLNLDLRTVLFPATAFEAEATRLLTETRLTQPALFVIEHALARLWSRWGVEPQAMLGHSLGEYVAACIAGVFTLEEALPLVAERARLMGAQPAGAMLAVRLDEARLTPLLTPNLALAAVNAPGLSVVSGPFDAIDALEQRLAASAIPFKRLQTSHAFHSAMMEPAAGAFADFLRRRAGRSAGLRAPQKRWVSNASGDWIAPTEATDPEYWARHLRQPVRFCDGVGRLLSAGSPLLLEVGPGRTLAGLARQHPEAGRATGIVASLARDSDGRSAQSALLHALGELWLAGVPIAWRQGFHGGEERRRVALPTYPFERKRYWIEPAPGSTRAVSGPTTAVPAVEAEMVASHVNGHAANAAPKINGHARSTVEGLREIFHELSGVDLARASDAASFYELGFDSLFLTQASQAVRQRFGIEITFRQLREDYPTFAALAAYVDKQKPATGAALPNVPPPSVASAAPIRRLPLTESQREIWYASQLGDAMSAAYNEASVLRLEGALDLAALRRALDTLIERHESLRVTVSASGEEQIFHASRAIELEQFELTTAESESEEVRVSHCLATELARSFDLVDGPACRFLLLRVDPRRHVLAVVVHHVVCDGWSLAVLLREIAELYSAAAEQRTPRLAAAPSFPAYLSESAPHTAPAAAAAESYWSEQFADGTPAWELPTDRPRPVERTYAGGFLVRNLSVGLAAEVREFCARHQCTPYTALLTAFTLLVHRLSGQDDVIIGVPATAQVMDGREHLVGHFANLLPIRSHARADESAAAHLATVSRTMSGALEHWRYPLANLVRHLGLSRDRSRVPLTPVVFNTTRRRGELAFSGLKAEFTGNPKPFVNFDLAFNFALTDDGIVLGCYYSSELYDEATIARWFGHFETLLRGLTGKPDAGVFELPLLSPTELRQIVTEWNQATLPYDHRISIAEIFEAQVRRTPSAEAVVGASERLTYQQLNDRADRVAATLREAGVGPESLVGVLVGRNPEALVAILGVLKAGGAYVPLDSRYPVDRLEFIVRDTRMGVLVTERALAHLIPAAGLRRCVLEDIDHSRPSPSPAPFPRATGENLAYVIYTSGSTGVPKGVAVEQRSVSALLAWGRHLYRPEQLAGVFFSTSVCFDVSVFEIFAPLSVGGKVIVADTILHLRDHPAAKEATYLSGVPSAVAEVVRAGLVPRSVHTVTLAGEMMPQSLVEALYRLPHIEEVFDHYGPTETTVYSSGGLRRAGGRPSIGRPLPNEQIYVLDPRGQPVPIGVAGEIHIGGDKLARGYLFRPELTAERFVTARFAPARRLYRTGDLGRFAPDGTIELIGRTDHQVKIRGFRIELGEIETALASHPAVQECAVIARVGTDGSNRLLAYAVPAGAAEATGPALREYLRRRLPDYMTPAAVMILQALPRTGSGKLDRQQLPEPDFGAAASVIVAARTTTEELLVDIWREVLGVTQLGVHDNFFELGGHSLLATQVLSRLQDALGVELTLARFFATPTVGDLAPAIEEALINQITASSGEDDAAPAAALLAMAKEAS